MIAEDDLPPKFTDRNQAQHMAMCTEVYVDWALEPPVWRSGAGKMYVADMTDQHCRLVLEQIRQRTQHFAARLVWGKVYLEGLEAAESLVLVFNADPWALLATTPLVQALEARCASDA